MSAPGSERLVHIDAMRAIAALLVVWVHVAENLVLVAGSGDWVHTIARDVGVGGVGVTLFFLISGFVIPSSLRNDRPRGQELRTFAIRRFFRLYPAFWLSIPFALVAIWWAFDKPISLEAIVANFTMVAQPFGFQLIEPPYWTLAIELAFYALCALLFALGLLRRAGALVGMSAGFAAVYLAAYLPWLPRSWTEFLYQDQFARQLSLMFCGSLLRRWHDGDLPEWAKLATVGMLSLWLALPFAMGLAFTDGQPGLVYSDVDGSRAIGILLFLLLAFVLKPRFRPLVALGQASYSLYLFHTIVALAVLWLAVQPGFAWLRGWDTGLYVLAVAALSIAVAFAVHALVELPFIRLGRALSRVSASAPLSGAARVHA